MKLYVSIIIPVYNEEEAVGDVLDGIKKVLRKVRKRWEVIVVDDGSTDDSYEIIKRRKWVKVIRHEINRGYGAALKSGIKIAKGRHILIIDSDGSYPVEDIPKLIALSKDYDMVIGARTGKRVEDEWLRKPAKWFLNRLANYLTGYKIPDLNSGMRIFKKDLAMRFFNLFPDGFSFTATLTVAALTNNYRVKFIPINYYKRKGKSSIRPLRDFMNFVYLLIRLTTYFKPLNVFLPTSFVLFGIGFLKAMRDFILLNHFGAGAVMIMLTAIQIAFLGLIADLIIRRTNL